MKVWQKKKISSRSKLIARAFFIQLFWKILAWTGLGAGLAFLGGFFGNKEFISQDIFGKVYKILTRSSNKWISKFFLGEGAIDRRNLLLHALILIGIITFLNIIVTLINLELKLKDRFIENNKYYLYGGLVFTLNTLIRIASYIVVILCFISAQTLILSLTFIFFHTWFLSKKLTTEPQTENFLTWKDPTVKKIFICSSLVIIILPLIHDRIANLQQQLLIDDKNSFSKFKELVINLVNSIPLLKVIFESLTTLSSFIHWIILIWFVRTVIISRINEYNDFWVKINGINKQATDFKQFYYYQKLLSEANVTSTKPDLPTQTKKMIILGDYNFLQITPNFLKKEYLEKGMIMRQLNSSENNILKEFSAKIKKIIEFIDFLPRRLNPTGQKASQQKKVNFLVYCLFNEFHSFAEIEQTQKLISIKKLSYV